MIAIIDYGAGNIESVRKALDYLSVKSILTADKREIAKADAIIFPGVGNFGYVMKMLRKKGLDKAIKDFISSGKPYFGICLGLQILFEESEESPGVEGLGIFKGKVRKFRKGNVPQIGWNKVKSKNQGIVKDGYYYFVNSYYAEPVDKSIALGSSDYYTRFCSAIIWKNVLATQFHPEKSGNAGIEMLRRWIKCLQKE